MDKIRYCSFCTKPEHDIFKLIANPKASAFICVECVSLCASIVRDYRRIEPPMKRPPHPGLSVKRDCLDPLGLSVAEGAERLGVDRHVLEDLIEGRARIDLDMAIKLEKAFGGTAETWACIQIAYDRAQSR